MLTSGKVTTLAQGIATAATENPDLYRQYREAMNAEMAAHQPAQWRRSALPSTSA